MGRVVIYGLLLCLVVVTVYLHNNRAKTEETPLSVTNASNLAEKPFQTWTPPAPMIAQEGAALQGEPQPGELRNYVPQEKPSFQPGDKDRELAIQAAAKFDSGDYEGAVRAYKELSERDKSALGGLGMAYLRLGDYENAEKSFEMAARNNPGDFPTRKALAFLCYKKDDIERGLSHAEAGLFIRKDNELQRIYDKLKQDKLTQESSESESASHFKITFDGYRHGGMSRKVLEILEEAYSDVGKEFGHFPSTPVNTILYTNRDFYDITQAPGWSGGIYDGKIRIPVRGAEGNEGLLKKILFHEYTHSVVHSLTQRCPLWINEGLAEYFSRKYQKKIGQVIPLNLLGSSFNWLTGDQVAVAYWESYSAVSHLINRHGIYRMKGFLQSLSEGMDVETAFERAFGQTYSEFAAEWGKS